MYSRFKLAKKYLEYYRKASSTKGHGIHSPFVFNFTKNVLNNNLLYPAYREVEWLRHMLLHDFTAIEIEDLGAGSAHTKNNRRKIADIAKHAAKPRKFSQLLFRIAEYYQPTTIIELGTSLGISTAYLAKGNPNAKVITIEGARELSSIAAENFKKLSLENITAMTGNFDDVLPNLINTLDRIDLVFIDGNHRRKPTLDYFMMLQKKLNNSSVLIFDDIHWSYEMEDAWDLIKAHPSVKVTIDLFSMGIVFFKQEFKIKQHFLIRY